MLIPLPPPWHPLPSPLRDSPPPSRTRRGRAAAILYMCSVWSTHHTSTHNATVWCVWSSLAYRIHGVPYKPVRIDHQPINISIVQSIFQSTNLSINLLINPSINQSINLPINQSFNRPINLPVIHYFNRSNFKFFNRSIFQWINLSITSPVYAIV